MDESSASNEIGSATTCEEALRLSNAGEFRAAAESFRLLVSRSTDPLEKASYLIEEADCYRLLGEFQKAEDRASVAKTLIQGDVVASLQIDFFFATLLISQDKREDGLRALATIVERYPKELQSGEGRELYEQIQIQRGLTFMHLPRYGEARPFLEEAASYQLSREDRSVVTCQLARCYCELELYAAAREQFRLAEEFGVSDEWAPTYHYYYGYTLYELKDFAAARRELLLCCQSGDHGPPKSYVYKLLGAIYRKLGEPEQARLYEKSAKSS